MKILLFGKNGQVGWELQRSLAVLGEVVAVSSASRDFCGNLADLTGIAQTVRTVAPDIIVNAAAYTAVDKAESEPELAWKLNAEAPGVLAQEAKQLGAWLVHYSTDYVFNGEGDTPHTETDATDPVSRYGETKLGGEHNIQAASCAHLIFRTSWVYAARGNNFIKTMLRLAQQRDKLSVVNDQIGSPTGAELIADATAYALLLLRHEPEVSGLYHLTANGYTSWYDFAKLVLERAGNANLPLKVRANDVESISTENYPLPAKRPLNSRLDTSKLENTFGLRMPDWQRGVLRVVDEIVT